MCLEGAGRVLGTPAPRSHRAAFMRARGAQDNLCPRACHRVKSLAPAAIYLPLLDFFCARQKIAAPAANDLRLGNFAFNVERDLIAHRATLKPDGLHRADE